MFPTHASLDRFRHSQTPISYTIPFDTCLTYSNLLKHYIWKILLLMPLIWMLVTASIMHPIPTKEICWNNRKSLLLQSEQSDTCTSHLVCIPHFISHFYFLKSECPIFTVRGYLEKYIHRYCIWIKSHELWHSNQFGTYRSELKRRHY